MDVRNKIKFFEFEKQKDVCEMLKGLEREVLENYFCNIFF